MIARGQKLHVGKDLLGSCICYKLLQYCLRPFNEVSSCHAEKTWSTEREKALGHPENYFGHIYGEGYPLRGSTGCWMEHNWVQPKNISGYNPGDWPGPNKTYGFVHPAPAYQSLHIKQDVVKWISSKASSEHKHPCCHLCPRKKTPPEPLIKSLMYQNASCEQGKMNCAEFFRKTSLPTMLLIS